MLAQLFVELLLDTVAAEQRAQAKRHDVEPALEAHASCLLQLHDAGDRRRQAAPVGGFLLEMPAAGPRERVELRAAVVLARLPLRGDPPLLLQLVQRRIQRPVADLENVARDLFQALADRPPVQRFERDDFQDQQVQGALDEIGRFAHSQLPRLPRAGAYTTLLSVSKWKNRQPARLTDIRPFHLTL